MAKAFSDEKQFPFQKVRVTPDQTTPAELNLIFNRQSNLTLCVSFEGFEDETLGFVFNIELDGGKFKLVNILEDTEVIARDVNSLSQIIRHVAGIDYHESVQALFQSSRNNIGHVDPREHTG